MQNIEHMVSIRGDFSCLPVQQTDLIIQSKPSSDNKLLDR
jgi:hypothetical protein